MLPRKIRIIALVLVVCMLFSGCSVINTFLDYCMGNPPVVKFGDMEYTRPDMAALDASLQKACDTAENGIALQQVLNSIYAFYDEYDAFYTNYYLADIHYSQDLTSTYWEEEYNFCLENTSTADSSLDELYYALAKSPYREELEDEQYFGEGYFTAYDGESIWDETFMALMEQEYALQGQYYELTSLAQETEYYSEEYFSVYGTQMAELFVELVKLRQEIAQYAGYESYPAFAYDMYHLRDFSPAEAETYLLQVGSTMYDLYCQVNQSQVWEISYDYCSEADTFNYVKTAAKNMGGNVADAFRLLEEGELYDISYSETKMIGAFELYLWSYYQPFVFVSPYLDQSDKLSFAHEFGHFASDYVCYGSVVGTDVAEVQSQAMEYLSLLYAEDTDALTAYKMANSLCVYMEQAAYALFEQQVYDLKGDQLTVENVQALYAQIGADFGFDSWGWDSRDYVVIEHFFTSPMYIISYVVSNDVAFQIYQLELEDPGSGLELYQQCLESSDSFLGSFTQYYGLENPFAEGRLESVLQTLTEKLKDYL